MEMFPHVGSSLWICISYFDILLIVPSIENVILLITLATFKYHFFAMEPRLDDTREGRPT